VNYTVPVVLFILCVGIIVTIFAGGFSEEKRLGGGR
jgi:hypothetical protein